MHDKSVCRGTNTNLRGKRRYQNPSAVLICGKHSICTPKCRLVRGKSLKPLIKTNKEGDEQCEGETEDSAFGWMIMSLDF